MDPVVELRRATLTALKLEGDLMALIPASSIFGQTVPAVPVRPFAKFGVPITVPREAACLNGAEVRFALHIFAGPRLSNGRVVETGEDHVGRIIAASKSALHNKSLATGSGTARLRFIGEQRTIDGDADHYHASVEFRAKVSG